MSSTNIKLVFLFAIFSTIRGAWNIGKEVYTTYAWSNADGTVVDFERNIWSCGKETGECYQLIIGYHASKKYFTMLSKKTFNYNAATHLLDKKIRPK